MMLPSPREIFPFQSGSYRMSMGLNELDLADWIQIDSDYPKQIARKRSLLTQRHADVFSALPGTEDSGREVLELLMDHLLKVFPQYFERTGSVLQNLIVGERWDLASPGLHPLDLAARLVQEDLCLMRLQEGVYVLAAASVCFPSRWKLSEKMGRPMQQIHTPVPYYREKIGAATDRFMSTISIERPVWRVNWSLHDSPELFQPVSMHGNATVTPANAGETLFIRVERQTLRRLQKSTDVLFTIRTYVQPLSLLKNNQVAAAELAGALRNLPPETFAYKSLAGIIKPALEWLDTICS